MRFDCAEASPTWHHSSRARGTTPRHQRSEPPALDRGLTAHALTTRDPACHYPHRSDCRRCCNHVVKESICRKLKYDVIAADMHIETSQLAHRRFRLTFGGTECAEIMLAQQRRCSLAHATQIEWRMVPADPAMIDRWPHRMVQENVAIPALESGIACVEF